MTRPRDKAAGLFHVTCHSVWDGVLYRDDIDRTNYVHELARIANETGLCVLSTCLLTTHVHNIFEVVEEQLANVMQDLNFRYACRFNSRHRRRGRVLGAPYGCWRIGDDEHLKTVFRYVALNPVEAGLAKRPQDWHWSSYASTVGVREGFEFVNANRVIGSFGGPREVAIARLRRFVEGT